MKNFTRGAGATTGLVAAAAARSAASLTVAVLLYTLLTTPGCTRDGRLNLQLRSPLWTVDATGCSGAGCDNQDAPQPPPATP